MARSRNIKPGFFTNDALAELPALTRLMFIGIWTLADREGRIEDRPKKIKAECMPYDAMDADEAIAQLTKAGFLHRYESGGVRCIAVVTWGKHQNPHVKEGASTLPAPDKHQTSTGHAPCNTQPLPALAGLIPDSGFLIPDSLIKPSNLAVACPRPASDDPTAPQLSLVEKPAEPGRKGIPQCPHREVLALWAEVLPSMPQHDADQWRGSRADHLRARWRETAEARKWATQDQGLTYFRRLFGHVGKSPFLTGKEHDPKRRPFFAELAWLVEPLNWAKTHEGKFHQEAA